MSSPNIYLWVPGIIISIFQARGPFASLVSGNVNVMNALPIKNTPYDVIDDLIASFGVRRVLLAVAARIFRRTRPPDTSAFPDLERQPGIDALSDHLRQDLGLPPEAGHRVYIDPIILGRHMF